MAAPVTSRVVARPVWSPPSASSGNLVDRINFAISRGTWSYKSGTSPSGSAHHVWVYRVCGGARDRAQPARLRVRSRESRQKSQTRTPRISDVLKVLEVLCFLTRRLLTPGFNMVSTRGGGLDEVGRLSWGRCLLSPWGAAGPSYLCNGPLPACSEPLQRCKGVP